MTDNINRKTLVSTLAELTGESEATAARFLRAYENTIRLTLANGGEVRLNGFGRYLVAERAGRLGRNPKTGETIQIPPSLVPKFVPAQPLKDACKRPF